MLFTTGPCTLGPATIAASKMTKTCPSEYQELANEFYQELTHRAWDASYTVDICACLATSTSDRIGLSEMKWCADMTGGSIVSGASYSCPLLQDQIRKLLCADQANLVYHGVLSVQTTRDLGISGVIGSCQPLQANSGWSHSPADFPSAGSCKLFNLNATTTLGVYLTSKTLQCDPNRTSTCCIQLVTSYFGADGQKYSRVATVKRPRMDQSSDENGQFSVTSFDSGAAAVLVTRWALHQSFALDAVACNIEDHLPHLSNRFDGDHFDSFVELMHRLVAVFKHLKTVEDDCVDRGACHRHWMARADVGELLAMTSQHTRVDFVAIDGLDSSSGSDGLALSTHHRLLSSFFSVKNTAEQFYRSFYVDTTMSYN